MPRTSLVFRRVVLGPLLALSMLLAVPALAQADPAPPTIAVAPPGVVLAEQDATVTGTGEPGAEIQVQVDGADEGPRITVGLDGTWTKTDVPITFGSSTVLAEEYVDDELVGTSDEVTIIGLFAFAFAQPEVEPIFEISGDATPGSTVVVKDETGATIATLITTDCGCIDQDTTVPLSPGAHTLTYTASLSGVTTPVSDPINVVVIPPAPALFSPTDGEIVDAGVVHFSGLAEPDATVNVTAALRGVIATGTADEDGFYELDTASLDPATLSVTVTQTLDGAESVPTDPIDVIVAWPAPTLSYDGTGVKVGGDPLPVSGTGHPGSEISIQVNSQEEGTATVLEDGTWSGSVIAEDGDNYLTAVQDGVRSSDPVLVEALLRPMIDNPDEGATVPPTFTIDGGAYPDEEVVAVDENGDPFGTVTPDDCGCFSVTNTTPLSNGPHTITLTQVHEGTPVSRDLHVTVDPDALYLANPRDGDLVPQGLTHFTGSGKAGATVDLYEEDVEDPIGTTTIGLDGTFDLTATLAPGARYLSLVQTIEGVPGTPLDVSLFVLLDPPTIEIDGPSTVVEGEPIHVKGVALPHAMVVVNRNGVPLDAVEADEDGNWAYDVPALSWDNYIDAFQTADSNFSFNSEQVHAIGVGAPTVSNPIEGNAVTATFDADGSAVPGGIVTVADEDDTVLGTAVPDGTTGTWSLTTTVPLAPGTHTLHVFQTLDGVTGPTTEVGVQVRPDAPTVTSPGPSSVNPVRFAGTGTIGATVDVYEAGTTTDPFATTTVELDGTYDVSATLPYGNASYDVVQTVGGAPSDPTTVNVTVLLDPPALGAPPTVTSGDTVEVTGTAMPGATVELLRNSSLVDTVTADEIGDWVAHFTAIDGDNYLAASQTLGDDYSPVSEETLVIGVGQPFVATPQEGDDVSPLFTLSGYGLAGAEIAVENAIGAPIGTGTVDGDGTWDVTTTVPLSGGTQVVRVTQLFNGTTSPPTERNVNVTGPVPTNVTLPAITTTTATPAVGVRLVRTLGTWTGTPTGYGYQWVRCAGDGTTDCANIPGETAATYLPTASDAGSTFRVRVTATNGYGSSLPATSAASGVVTAQVPAIATAPTVPTTTAPYPSIGVRLVRNAGTWTGPVTSYAYQWQRCNGAGTGCASISGETATSYLPVAADAGSTFRVIVTAHNDAGDSLPATSPVTAVVTQPVPTIVTTPAAPTTTTPAPTVGVRLNRTLGTWAGTPTSYTYQWQRCNGSGSACADIAGETATTYKPVTADVGSTFRVAVTGINAGGPSLPAISDATSPVIAPVPVSTATPPSPTTTAPSPNVGVRLVRVVGSWSNVPTSYTYQWRRCNGSGTSCADITGETATSYMPVVSDVGSTFRVVIVAHNDAGASLPATSDTTAAVTQPPPSIVTPPSTTVSLPVVGVRLTRTLGTWTGTPTSYAYQWQKCDGSGNGCTDIPGATGATYRPLESDLGSTFRVLVTASNAAGPSEPAPSVPTMATVASSGT